MVLKEMVEAEGIEPSEPSLMAMLRNHAAPSVGPESRGGSPAFLLSQA